MPSVIAELNLGAAAMTDLDRAIAKNSRWIPACGGTETPFVSRSGRTLLYCYNPGEHRHAYIDVATDIILTDDEAARLMQMY